MGSMDKSACLRGAGREGDGDKVKEDELEESRVEPREGWWLRICTFPGGARGEEKVECRANMK